MFKELTMDELLSQLPNGLMVSIYLSRASDSLDDRIEMAKLKTQLKEVRKLLEAHGGAKHKKEIIASFEKCLSHSEWIPRSGSVGLFYSSDLQGFIKLPFQTKERSIVADSFHLKPIFKWLHTQNKFYLLDLDSMETTLYRGSDFLLEPIAHDLSGASSINPGNSSSGMSSSDFAQKRRRQFLATVEAKVLRHLQGETAPLLLSGHERSCSLFAEASGYPFIVSERVSAESSENRVQVLHQSALKLVAQLTSRKEELAINDYRASLTRKRATSDLNEVALALRTGRVKRLFVAEDTHLTGQINKDGTILILNAKPAAGDDVLDDLAELAAAHNSQVVVLPRHKMPEAAPAAATLRW